MRCFEFHDARNLERLDLSRNGVGDEGLQTMLRAGINASANKPLSPEEIASNEYLHEGDFE